jgi:Tfp pilus assembly protein PilN
MKAVNLIPVEARRAGGRSSGLQVPIYLFLGLLVGVLALVTVWVLAGNTIASRKAQLADLQGQVTAEQALASKLVNYAQFASVAQSRVQTVRTIAATRFHWHAVLSQLAQVVPANTSLLSVQGTVAPGASAGGSTAGGGGAGGTANVRSQINNPALEMTGCTTSQDDVARLMSRLRLISGVTRVTLGASVKASPGSGGSAGASGNSGCPANQPAFDVVVFFAPLPGAGPTGAIPVSGPSGTSATAGGSAPPGASAPATGSKPATGSATPGAGAPASGSATPGSQPATHGVTG